MLKNIVIKITSVQAGKRLDQVLHESLPEMSRSLLQKGIRNAQCTVDGILENRPDARTKNGQSISYKVEERHSELQPETGEVEVVWRDKDFLVCSKPAGLTVHPCPSQTGNTLIQRLLNQFPEIGEQGGQRPGIVHRIDKNTSGLLLVALNDGMRQKLSQLFLRREITKDYLALVSGVPPGEGSCFLPIGRHPTVKTKMAIVTEKKGGRPAHTEWKRLWSSWDKKISLLRVRIFTGRTHQIRVHFSQLGFPLLGDDVYASEAVAKMGPRQMLHAFRLSFIHPDTREPLCFSLEPPEDFKNTAICAHKKMQRIVVTGNQGCGKSSFCQELEKLGIPAISSDQIVSDLYLKGNSGASWLVQRFGERVQDENGAIDKKALFKMMEASPEIRREVETNIQALVRLKLDEFWKKRSESGQNYALAEIPLYFECGWDKLTAPETFVVVVSCPTQIRWERLARTRGWTQEKISIMESWQWDEKRKISMCDFVVRNFDDRKNLAEKAKNLLSFLQEKIKNEKKEHVKILQEFWTTA